MNVITLDELAHQFQGSLYTLKHALMLSDASADKGYNEVAQSLNQVLDGLKVELRSMRRNVENEKKQLHQLEDIKQQSQILLQHLQFSLDNIPSKLPQKKPLKELPPSNVTSNTQEVENESQNLRPVAQPVNPGCNYLDFLTVDEFESVPKYMKGRLTYDKVNSAIEQLDRVFTEKYKILKQKKATLNDLNRKRYEAFKLQENKDTRGIDFIVEKDIPEYSSLKLDKGLRNILTILRHCGLMHEIRGGGHVRLAIYTRY